MTKPKRVSDVLDLTADTITYQFTGANGTPGQSTYRVERTA